MALLSNALTTVQRVKDFAGINNSSLDTVIERLINSVTEFIEGYCQRTFLLATYTNEEIDGMGINKISVRQYPVVAITSLERRASTENINSWDSVDSNMYFLRTANGMIESSGWVFTRGRANFRATYSAGYDYDQAAKTLESIGLGDLEYAVWKLVQAAILNRKDNPKVQSETIGNYSVTYRKEAQRDAEINEILDRYARPQSIY